jgi:hypothetical protein
LLEAFFISLLLRGAEILNGSYVFRAEKPYGWLPLRGLVYWRLVHLDEMDVDG